MPGRSGTENPVVSEGLQASYGEVNLAEDTDTVS
jgi:hypothetical protein